MTEKKKTIYINICTRTDEGILSMFDLHKTCLFLDL
jgi:hypothetical protein